MEKKFNKILRVDLKDDAASEAVIKALNCKTRRDILRLMADGSMGIWEIAKALNVPLSSISEHVGILVKAGIVSVVRKAADRGSSKIISRQYERIEINIVPDGIPTAHSACHTQEIPIGSYTNFSIKQYCGMLAEQGYIGDRDDPTTFYSPLRSTAGLLWFDCGYLEYRIPIKHFSQKKITSLAFSLELCSEAPAYNENWPSDIYFEVNGKRICTYTCPGDFGARPGIHTPKWWRGGTQYGLTKKLEIKENGSFLDEVRVSDITLSDLSLSDKPTLCFRLGVDENAKNRGGINLFGKGFGDHGEHIICTIFYKE
ncbi:MAG: ArsR family transcriptional regulator [Ruminococcaceae bacterium]|nr:ArsR family transcriptional regulator [Oscillospiraceae bacterium]